MLSSAKDTKIAVIGDGGWGTTLAIHLANKGYSPRIWGAFPRYLAEIEELRENKKFLPGFHIPENVTFHKDISDCLDHVPWVILAVPSQYLGGVLKRIPDSVKHKKIWVCVTKGIENRTLRLMTHVIEDQLGHYPMAVLSGPTIAREVAHGMPVATAVASKSKALRARVRKLFNGEHFTVYESNDPIGVQLGGSIKNVIAIAAGIVDGLDYGCNTKSVLVARGIAEMARLGRAMGANRATFMGLSGLGDLTTTCFSIHSRNHKCGIEIGKGASITSVIKSTEMVIEGIDTARSANALAKKYGVEMPIVQSVYDIIFRGKSPKVTIEALMHKKLVKETD